MIPTRTPVPRYNLRHILAAILWMAALGLIAGCGGAEKKIIVRVLPENVMAHPRGTVGIVVASHTTTLPTALRALGVPYRAIPLAQLQQYDLSAYQVVIVDEKVLDEDKDFAAYNLLYDGIRKHGFSLVMLQQSTAKLEEAARKARYKMSVRDVEYRLDLRTPRRDDPMMSAPNRMKPSDLDSLSPATHQLVTGGRDARAIISANLDAPDSAAALLWEPVERGALWYMSFPLTERAALGFAAEQRLLANLVSNK